MLNVRVSTVYEWARMDYIPHIHLGTGRKEALGPFLPYRRSRVAGEQIKTGPYYAGPHFFLGQLTCRYYILLV